MSVRSRRTAPIAAADALYARMRRRGHPPGARPLAPTGLAAALGKVPPPSLKARIHLICGGLAVLTVIVAAAGLNATDHARGGPEVAVTDEAAIVRQPFPDDPCAQACSATPAPARKHCNASKPRTPPPANGSSG
jgi:hypothetical protein